MPGIQFIPGPGDNQTVENSLQSGLSSVIAVKKLNMEFQQNQIGLQLAQSQLQESQARLQSDLIKQQREKFLFGLEQQYTPQSMQLGLTAEQQKVANQGIINKNLEAQFADEHLKAGAYVAAENARTSYQQAEQKILDNSLKEKEQYDKDIKEAAPAMIDTMLSLNPVTSKWDTRQKDQFKMISNPAVMKQLNELFIQNTGLQLEQAKMDAEIQRNKDMHRSVFEQGVLSLSAAVAQHNPLAAATMAEAFKTGDYAGGLLAGTQALDAKERQLVAARQSGNDKLVGTLAAEMAGIKNPTAIDPDSLDKSKMQTIAESYIEVGKQKADELMQRAGGGAGTQQPAGTAAPTSRPAKVEEPMITKAQNASKTRPPLYPAEKDDNGYYYPKVINPSDVIDMRLKVGDRFYNAQASRKQGFPVFQDLTAEILSAIYQQAGIDPKTLKPIGK